MVAASDTEHHYGSGSSKGFVVEESMVTPFHESVPVSNATNGPPRPRR